MHASHTLCMARRHQCGSGLCVVESSWGLWHSCSVHLVPEVPRPLLSRLNPHAARVSDRVFSANICLRVHRRPVFASAILGNTLHTALLGMFAYWGPKAVTFMFAMAPGSADVLFGAITVGTGILGTLAGGSLLDTTGGAGPRPRHAAARVCLFSVGGGFLMLQAAFGAGRTLLLFSVLFALGEFLLFMIQVWFLPLQNGSLHCSDAAGKVFVDPPEATAALGCASITPSFGGSPHMRQDAHLDDHPQNNHAIPCHSHRSIHKRCRVAHDDAAPACCFLFQATPHCH